MTAYKFLVKGIFPEDKIKVEKTNKRMFTTPELEDIIDSEWNKLRDEKVELDYKSPRKQCRLEDYKVNDGKLILKIGDTNYKESMGVKSIANDILDIYGYSYFPNSLSLGTIVETKDNKLIFQRKSNEVPEYKRFIDTIDACPESEDKNVFKEIKNEIQKKLEIGEGYIEYIYCTGLIRDVETKMPGLIFDAKIDVPIDELEKIIPAEEEPNKYCGLLYVKKNESTLVDFLFQHDEHFLPLGEAVLQRYIEIEYNSGDTPKFLVDKLRKKWLRERINRALH